MYFIIVILNEYKYDLIFKVVEVKLCVWIYLMVCLNDFFCLFSFKESYLENLMREREKERERYLRGSSIFK